MKEPSYLPSDNPRVPSADYPFRHCLPVQIRFTDIDLLGHLNNNVYLTFMDLAKIRYFSDVQGRDINVNDLCMVVVNINCDFMSPSFLADSLEVWTRVTRIGERSLHLEQRIVDANTGETKCIGRTVMAGYDPETLQGAPLRADWVEMTEAYEQRSLRTDKSSQS